MSHPASPATSRATAARAVAAVRRGRSLDDALPAQADSLARAISYGVLRQLTRLDVLLDSLTERPLKKGSDLQALVLCGLHQLLDMAVPAHAALNETVNACALIEQPRARGLVNALLRRVQREGPALVAALPGHAAVRWSYPDWMLDTLQQDWGARTEAVLASGNEQAPMTLRVNRRQGSVSDYQARLQAEGLASTLIEGLPDALRLTQAVAVERLPGFTTGAVSVQDASAQLAADLLDVRDGQRVLDACAAPGGKTAHLLERADVQVTALDSDPTRLGRMRRSLDRLGLQAHLALSDAADVKRWWDGEPFDRILIDAPCSGTGVIRRHPDIKWLRRDTDIPPLVLTQRRLLDRLWPLLKPDGVLVYATCSVLRAEGDAGIKTFLQRTPDARPAAVPAPVGLAERCGLRIPPGGDFDGFYYARLTRRGNLPVTGVR